MSMQLVSFRATLRDASLMPTHEQMVTGMRDLAEAIDGFVEWRAAYDGLTYWGYVVFATPDAALAWKGHPTHGAIHRQGEDSVYSEFGTQVFELVREASWSATRSDRTRMADEPYVDTHIHFWDKSVDGLQWAWLEPGFGFRKWTSSPIVDAPRYGPPEFLEEAAGTGIAGAVHVNCADPLPDPSAETAWIDFVAATTGWPQAQVGRCDLNAPDAAATIMAEAASPLFRGVRDPFSAKRLDAAAAAPAMGALAATGASLEVRRHHSDFTVLDELAARWPTVTILLSHGCLPLERTPEEHAAWSAAMRSLARRPNVACKISTVVGASQPDPSLDRVQPWILACIDAFGADRCMLGSNFPVDRPYCTYAQLVDLYRQSIAELSASERAAVLAGTAARLYGFELVTPAPATEDEPE